MEMLKHTYAILLLSHSKTLLLATNVRHLHTNRLFVFLQLLSTIYTHC